MAAIEQNRTGPGATSASAAPSTMRRLRAPLMIAAPVVILAAGGFVYLTGGRYQSTDDAYVQAARVTISTNVPGRVSELLVHENQNVKAGQVLFRLDTRDLDAAVAAARVQLAQARLQVHSIQASFEPAQAALHAAEAEVAYREKELARQTQLTQSGVGSQRELDERRNDLTAARDKVTAAQAQLQQSLATIGGPANGPVDSNPAVQAAKVALDRALLNRSYTTVVAPQDGQVTRVEQLQVGSYVTAAQPLFTLVAPRMWIDANFKEDQLSYMRVGEHGVAHIDAFPDQSFPVHVDSLSPGTGTAFSILPPENATGNWVKVTQRLPVRIAFDDPEALGARLHAGLSAKVKIDTLHKRTLFGRPPPAPRP